MTHGKDPDAGRDCGQEEKGTTEDEMAGCHHDSMDLSLGKLRELVMDRGLACCNSWGRKESGTTERLTELMIMGLIKDRNGMDLTEAEDIKKRWPEYTEELYKKDLHDPDNYDGVITHLELDILECEVKCAIESITTNKASGGDGIPVELFQILKDDAVKVLHSICQQVWKTQQ